MRIKKKIDQDDYRARWTKIFVLLPRGCIKCGDRIWLEDMYIKRVCGPGTDSSFECWNIYQCETCRGGQDQEDY